MKIIDHNPSSWGDKINFVDVNNVVVGFDMDASCCESFGWLLTAEIPSATDAPQVNCDSVEPYVFDTAYRHDGAIPDHDGGGSVTFRLVHDYMPPVYLTLYNHHNGYYSHGFDMKAGEKTVFDGSL